MSHSHEPMICSECGYTFDTSTSAYGKDKTPAEGDLSICLNCGGAMMLDSGRWRSMTFDEIVDLDPTERAQLFKVQAMQRMLKETGMGDLRRKNDGTSN